MRRYEQDVYFLLNDDFDNIKNELLKLKLAEKIIKELTEEFDEVHKFLGNKDKEVHMINNLTWEDRVKIHEFNIINKIVYSKELSIEDLAIICTDVPFHTLITTELSNIINFELIALAEEKEKKLKYVCYKDELTCPECQKRDGTIYTVKEAEKLMRHPNCRCLLIPV